MYFSEYNGGGRNVSLDFAKAICIILMVIGHSGCPTYLRDFLYLFHMPCFFFISGYLLNDKYMKDIKMGLRRKLKGLYFPYVKWTVFFLLLNLFSRLFIMGETSSVREIFAKLVGILTMSHLERLVGGYWFLVSLFIASVISMSVLYALRNASDKGRYAALASVGVLILLFGVSQEYLSIKLPVQFIERTCLGGSFYISGYLFRKANIQIRSSMGLLVPAFMALFVHWGTDSCTGWQILPYYIVAMCGTLGVISISSQLPQTSGFSAAMSYVGKRTFDVLTFHFLAFKLVSAVYIFVCHLPIQALSAWPVLTEVGNGMWIVYSFFGVVFPLLVRELLDSTAVLCKRVWLKCR